MKKILLLAFICALSTAAFAGKKSAGLQLNNLNGPAAHVVAQLGEDHYVCDNIGIEDCDCQDCRLYYGHFDDCNCSDCNNGYNDYAVSDDDVDNSNVSESAVEDIYIEDYFEALNISSSDYREYSSDDDSCFADDEAIFEEPSDNENEIEETKAVASISKKENAWFIPKSYGNEKNRRTLDRIKKLKHEKEKIARSKIVKQQGKSRNFKINRGKKARASNKIAFIGY